MPIVPESLHHSIRDWLLTLPTLGAISIGMTAHTPSIAVLLNKWSRTVEGFTTLCAEEVARVPFRAAGNDDFAFNRRLAALASGGEKLVKVQVAVESQRSVSVLDFLPPELVDRDSGSSLPGLDSGQALSARFLRLRVEGDQFEVGVALVTDEA